jgi:hypothetical protein
VPRTRVPGVHHGRRQTNPRHNHARRRGKAAASVVRPLVRGTTVLTTFRARPLVPRTCATATASASAATATCAATCTAATTRRRCGRPARDRLLLTSRISTPYRMPPFRLGRWRRRSTAPVLFRSVLTSEKKTHLEWVLCSVHCRLYFAATSGVCLIRSGTVGFQKRLLQSQKKQKLCHRVEPAPSWALCVFSFRKLTYAKKTCRIACT